MCCAVVLCFPLSRSSLAGPSTQWSVGFLAGHDDQVLADQDLGILAPVSEAFATGSSSLRLRWTDASGGSRLALLARAAGTVYGPAVQGDDSDYRAGATYRRRLSPRLTLLGTLGGWRFRRGDDSVFDVNLLRAGARLAWFPHENWVFGISLRGYALSFPHRGRLADPDDPELQHWNRVALGGTRNFGRGGYAGLQAWYRRTSSNEPLSEYGGSGVTARGGISLPLRLDATVRVSYSHRNYDDAPALVPDKGGGWDSLGTRADDAWQVEVRMGRRLGPQVRAFAEGTALRQRSNDKVVGFDEARIVLGVQVDLLPSPRSRVLRPDRPSRLAPQVTPGGVRFRFRDPTAEKVSVVGGFNGWDPTRHLLAGPDADGIWEGIVPVRPGTWQYAFVVDGKWVAPAGASRYEDDGFGGRNGVLDVPAPREKEPVTGASSSRRNR